MHPELRDFLARFTGTVMMALVPVVIIAFLSMPVSLGRHPGELPSDTGAASAYLI